MTGLGLAPYFAASVSSGVVGYEKPHRRLFEAALAETPPGSRIWMIGDNIDCDCRPVAAFGAEAILVRNDDAAGPHGGLRAQDLHEALELLETGASVRRERSTTTASAPATVCS